MPASDWTVRTREHTFSTGRTATLREQLPTTELIRQGVLDGDSMQALQALAEGRLGDPAQAAALSDAICIGMFVDPQLALPDPETGEIDDGKAPLGVLDEVEIYETIDLAFKEIAARAPFRGKRRRSRAGGDGEVLGDDTERAARAKPRKPRAARSRPKAG